MLYSCQDFLPFAQKPVALQRRFGLLGQGLRDVALRHQLSPIASIASNLFFLMTVYNLPPPTANSQAYTVKLIQKSPTLLTPDPSFSLWQSTVATKSDPVGSGAKSS